MIRKFKALGFATLGVLAMSAVMASAAQASNFTASKYPTAVKAESGFYNDDLKTEAGSVECLGTFESSDLTEPGTALTVNPTYTNCRAFGFLTAEFKNGVCRYIVEVDGTVDYKCSILTIGGFWVESPAVITAGTCEMEISSQSNLSSFVMLNGFGGVVSQAKLAGIKYKVTKDGIGCPFAGTGSKTGAEYIQNSAVIFKSTNGAAFDIG